MGRGDIHGECESGNDGQRTREEARKRQRGREQVREGGERRAKNASKNILTKM